VLLEVDESGCGTLCMLLRNVRHIQGFAQLLLGVEGFSALPDLPFTQWAMDLISPLPKSRVGHEWIVTWGDCTSKLILAAAVKTGQSSEQDLADLMFIQICCRFGLPTKITHDNDVLFKHVWHDICQCLSTKFCGRIRRNGRIVRCWN
jgi:hypothetical protein